MSNTTPVNFENLSEGQIKQIALMQHLDEPFFINDGEVFKGTLDEAKDKFSFEAGSMHSEIRDSDNFDIWCSNNLEEIGEYDEYGDYLVLTDEEADEVWDERLNNYLEDCIYPELSGHLKNYFDDEKWKQDARYDGRGHAISSYDGNENEETVNGTTYFIYRIN